MVGVVCWDEDTSKSGGTRIAVSWWIDAWRFEGMFAVFDLI